MCPGAFFDGAVSLQNEDGYQVQVVIRIRNPGFFSDVTGAAPGFTDMVATSVDEVTGQNETAGRGTPVSGVLFTPVALYSMDSGICVDTIGAGKSLVGLYPSVVTSAAGVKYCAVSISATYSGLGQTVAPDSSTALSSVSLGGPGNRLTDVTEDAGFDSILNAPIAVEAIFAGDSGWVPTGDHCAVESGNVYDQAHYPGLVAASPTGVICD